MKRTWVLVVLILLLVAGNTALVVWLQGNPPRKRVGVDPKMVEANRPVRLRAPTADEGKRTADARGTLRVEVVDGEGRPLPGATVRVRADRRAVRSPFPDPVLAEGGSGSDGSVEFTLPPRARYRVDGSMEGRASATATGTGIVRLRIPAGGTILGRLLVEGTTTPVPGVEVLLLPPLVATWSVPRPDLPHVPRIEAAAMSGEDGTFRFHAVGPGFHRVCARLFPDPRVASGKVVEVPVGEEVRVDVFVGTQVDVPGRVVFVGSDMPVAGGRIRIVEPEEILDRSRAVRESPLDEEGRFLLAGLSAGGSRMCMVTTAQGIRVDAFLPAVVPPADGGRVAAPVTVTVPWSIRDEAPPCRGRVVDSRGRPVEGARVLGGWELESQVAMRDRGGWGGVDQSFTDADGRFTLEDSRNSPEEVLVLHPDYAPGALVQGERNRKSECTIVLPDPFELVVRVRDEAGHPVAGAEVIALLRHSDPWGNGAWVYGDVLEGLRSHPVTDAEGVAVVTGLGPGKWFIAAQAGEGGSRARKAIELAGPGARALDLVLESGPAVEGRVIDTEGKGVEGASISIQDNIRSGTRTVLTDREGRFAFTNVLVDMSPPQPGRVRVYLDWTSKFSPDGMREYFDAEPGTPIEWRVKRLPR